MRNPPELKQVLPLSFVPPVVAVLPQMASHESRMEAAASFVGLTLDRAFEIHTNHAFAILGYRTTLLGKGSGRAPDGIALFQEGRYAIIWDAKVRRDGYRMGTDDRAIREYIVTRSRKLRKLGCINIYFAVVSSSFPGDSAQRIRELKLDTGVNSVCLIEAAAIVAMVDARTRWPLDVELEQSGLQRLFTDGGIVSPTEVQNLIAGLDR